MALRIFPTASHSLFTRNIKIVPFNLDNMDDERLSCVCRVKTEVESQISDPCTINTNEIKTNEPAGVKNEVIWDFVDILVDEIELWVEVRPIIISVEPYVLELLDPLK